jgi:cobalamin transport system substrate-binding protein
MVNFKKPIIKLSIILFVVGILLSLGLSQVDLIRPINANNNMDLYPKRVICSAPNIVEVVYALGQEKRVIGVSDFTIYPPEALEKDKIGGWINPNFEKVLSLRPDLVIVQGEMAKYLDFCKDKNIPVLRVDMENLASMYDGIKVIGEALGCGEKATEIITKTRKELDLIRNETKNNKVKADVFITISRRIGSLSGIYTINGTTFINELLNIAGGRNVFEDASGRYPVISKESLLVRNPDIIIELKPGEEIGPQDLLTMKNDWQAMPTLGAVASGRIHCVTDDFILMMSPRITLTARRFYEVLHDDRY